MEMKERIKTARKSARLTQDELAIQIGVSRAAVVQWERGQTKSLKGENLARAARALGVESLWIATGEEPMHAPLMARDDPDDVPREIVQAWRQLDRNTRAHLLALMQALRKKT